MFDSYGRARWTISYTGRSTSNIETQITFDGDLPMPFGVLLHLRVLGMQEVEDMRKAGPGCLRLWRLHHDDHFIGAEFSAVATADAFLDVNLHHPVGVTHNGVGRTILEARGAFTVATGHRHMHPRKARTIGTMEAGLALVGGSAGCHTVVTPDALGLINEENVGT